MNELAAGFRLSVAPRFHSPVAWSDRLRINSGTQWLGGVFIARPAWRAPSPAELQRLLAPDEAATDQDFSNEGLTLFGIPEHLRRTWWDTAAQEVAEGNAAGPGSQAFTRALGEFLAYKGWPFPLAAACDLILSETGQPSTRLDPATGNPGGLAVVPAAPVWGVLNLGDEATALHFVNLSLAQCRELLRPGGQLADVRPARFFEQFPDYPLVRLQLEPGEAVRFPGGGLFWDSSTVGKDDLDVLLIVRSG
jgi:hypothetical protein